MPTFLYQAPNGQRRVITALMDLSDDDIAKLDVLKLAGLAYSEDKGLHRTDMEPSPPEPPMPPASAETASQSAPAACALDKPLPMSWLRASRCRFLERTGPHWRSDCKCGVVLGWCHRKAYEARHGDARDDAAWEEYRDSLPQPRPRWEPDGLDEHAAAMKAYYRETAERGMLSILRNETCRDCEEGWRVGGGIKRGKSKMDGKVLWKDAARGTLKLLRRYE